MAKIMMKGGPWKAVEATMGAAAVRFSPSAMAMPVASSVGSLGKIRGLFANERVLMRSHSHARLHYRLVAFKRKRPNGGQNSYIFNFWWHSSRQPSLVRGMRTATTEVPATVVKQAVKEDERSLSESESESEEGELAELPEDLDAPAWSVGLDGLNVGMKTC